MECFGEVQKLNARCSEAARSLIHRFATTNSAAQILITESANLVSKYDMETCKSIDSWSFAELNKLLAPMVVYFPLTGKKDPKPQETLIGLHSGNTVIEWAPSEKRELRLKLKKKLKNPVIAVLSFPFKSHFEPVVIFSNGYAEHWSSVKSDEFDESQIEPVIAPTEEIIALENYAKDATSATLYYIVRDTATEQKAVYKSIVFSKDSKKPTQTGKGAPLTVNIEAHAFSPALDCFIGASKTNDKINFYSLEPTAVVANVLFSLDSDNSDKLCSIATCSTGSIAVLIEKAKAKHSDVLFQVQIFERKYYAKIGQLNLSEAVFTRDFTVLSDSAVITCKSNVVVAPILEHTVRLSELLTKNLSSEEKAANIDRKFKEIVGVSIQAQSVRNLPLLEKLRRKLTSIVKGKFDDVDISEELVVSLFDFCTRNYLAIKEEQASTTEDGDQSITNQEREELLQQFKLIFGLVVKLPYNDSFLVSSLKAGNISMAQHLLAIEWLLNLMSCQDCSIVSWISALLDANFRQFIIKPSPEAQAALDRIYSHLNQCIHFYEGLGRVKTIFESLVKCDRSIISALVPNEENIGQYSIELLSFT